MMSHLIKIYVVCKFNYFSHFRLLYLKISGGAVRTYQLHSASYLQDEQFILCFNCSKGASR